MKDQGFAPVFAAVCSLVALVGCGGDDSSDSGPTGGAAGTAGTGGSVGGNAGAAGNAGTGGGSAGNAGTGGSAGEAGAAGAGGNPAQTRATISGDVTWTVTFDAAAQAAGATDCTYTRHYEGEQDESRPWVCPSCEVTFRATVEITEGLNDCYAQISGSAPMAEEWIGYGSGTWYRSYGTGASEQGTATVESMTVTTHNEVTGQEADLVGAGTFDFAIEGALALGEEAGDPMHGWVVPNAYACGWKKADPPEYDGDYTVASGATLPDGLFHDKCGEAFRLHDLEGTYLVLLMSAYNCASCNMMADGENQFVTDMAAQGIDAASITLLVPSLDDPFGDTTTSQLESWHAKHNITTPVVADRGWGFTMMLPIYEDQLGYPSWIVIDPALNVITHGTGVDWASIKAAIESDAQ
jgi:hypothetical protein